MAVEIPTPTTLAGVKVVPFQNKQQAIDSIISADGVVLYGVAVAVNPEKVMKAQEDNETLQIINSASIQYADGIGVVKVVQKKLGVKLERIAGCELWLDILERSAQFKLPVMLIGAHEGVVKSCDNTLSQRGVNVVASRNGFFESADEIIDLVLEVKPKIVIIAQGSPRQEKLIDKIRRSYPDAFFMGVGGSFDVLAGKVPRAPESWQKMHLEWLYRLVKEPKRIFRQKNLVKFMWLAIRGKL